MITWQCGSVGLFSSAVRLHRASIPFSGTLVTPTVPLRASLAVKLSVGLVPHNQPKKPPLSLHRTRKQLPKPFTACPTLHGGLALQQGYMRAQSQRLQLLQLGVDAGQPELPRLHGPLLWLAQIRRNVICQPIFQGVDCSFVWHQLLQNHRQSASESLIPTESRRPQTDTWYD